MRGGVLGHQLLANPIPPGATMPFMSGRQTESTPSLLSLQIHAGAIQPRSQALLELELLSDPLQQMIQLCNGLRGTRVCS